MPSFFLDLGTHSTRMVIDRGPVVSVRSLAAFDLERKEVRSIGQDAPAEVRKSGSRTQLARVMDAGAPAPAEVVRGFLERLLRSAGHRSFGHGSVTFAATTIASDLDHHALERCLKELGAREVTGIETPIAATAGIDRDVLAEIGTMTLVLGNSTTEAGIVSFGALAARAATRVGVRTLRGALQQVIRDRLDLVVTDEVASEILSKLIDFTRANRGARATIYGRSLADGESASRSITEEELFGALEPLVGEMIHTARNAIETASDQLVADVADGGVWLLGGGAHLSGIAPAIEGALGIPIHTTSEPELRIVKGLAAIASLPKTRIYW
jgi:rod shape-determining protein MreB